MVEVGSHVSIEKQIKVSYIAGNQTPLVHTISRKWEALGRKVARANKGDPYESAQSLFLFNREYRKGSVPNSGHGPGIGAWGGHGKDNP
jgi:hypothetical protein